MKKRTMAQILKELKEYNDTHEKSLSYGKFVKLLAEQEQNDSEKSKREDKNGDHV